MSDDKAKSNLDTVATLKSSLLTLRASTTVAVHWVPGHSLIYGNEIADLLAKRGADGTTCSSMPDVSTLIDFASNVIFRHWFIIRFLFQSSLLFIAMFVFANCL